MVYQTRMAAIADVLIPLALDTAYSYAAPAGLDLREGDVVQVPLGTRETVGVVWSLRAGDGGNLKRVTDKIATPPVSAPLRRLVDWVAWYTLAPKGSVLAMALKRPEQDLAEAVRVGVRPSGTAPKRMTPARARVLAAAQDGSLRLKRDLAEAAQVSLSVVDGLLDDGALEAVALAPEPVALPPDPDHARAGLSAAQQAAAAALIETIAPGEPAVTLLEGVTGAGKTEAYFEAVAEAMRRDRQALILMPEIALTAQFLDRFAK